LRRHCKGADPWLPRRTPDRVASLSLYDRRPEQPVRADLKQESRESVSPTLEISLN
jgi:hypothetical protein